MSSQNSSDTCIPKAQTPKFSGGFLSNLDGQFRPRPVVTGLRFEKSADPCAAHERSGVRQPDRRRAHREDAVAATGWWLRRRAAGWHVRAFSDTEVRIQVGSRCGSKAVRPEDIRSPTTAGDYTPRLHDARRARCDEAADRATAKSPKRQRSKRQRLKRRERDAEFQSARARPVDK